MCLPLLISLCTIKSRSSLLAPVRHPGGPGKRAAKRLWCRVVMSVILSDDVIRVLVSFSSNCSLQPVEYAVSALASFIQFWVRSKGTRHDFC